MKQVTIGQLKSNKFEIETIIEEIVEINENDIEETIERLKKLLMNIEDLNEAIFYKCEKLKQKFECEDEEYFETTNKYIKGFIQKLKIPKLGESQRLVQRNKEIIDMRRIEKYVKYVEEMETNCPEIVLDSLLNSKSKDNWKFMGELLYYVIKHLDCEDKTVYFQYSKELEHKMVSLFQEGFAKKNFSECRIAYEVLKQFERENVLVDEFIVCSKLHEIYLEESFSLFVKYNKIDISKTYKEKNRDENSNDNTDNSSCDPFERFVNRIEEEVVNFKRIFGVDEKIMNYLINKILHTKITVELEKYMGTDITFVIRLEHAYWVIVGFCDFLKKFPINIELEQVISEMFSRYIIDAHERERALFDEIFNLLINGSQTKTNNYIIMGEPVEKTLPVQAYKKLLFLLNSFETRSALFYEKKDSEKIITWFFDKMTVILEMIIDQSEDPVDIIIDLSNIFIFTKNNYNGPIGPTKSFIQQINHYATEAFEKKIYEVSISIKQWFNAFKFVKPGSDKEIITLIKTAVNAGKKIFGRNYENYIERCLMVASECFYQNIFKIVYDKNQLTNLQNALEKFHGYVIIEGKIEIIKKVSHIKEIVLLIAIEPSLFNCQYEEFKGSITQKEFLDLIKCRKDKEELKKICNLIYV